MSSINSANAASNRLPLFPGGEKSNTPNNDKSKEMAGAEAVQPNEGRYNKTSAAAAEELKNTINAIQGPKKSLEISIHQETHAIMIKVKNKDTGELIREAPPEKVLDAVAKLMEVTGLIVDKKI